MAGIMDTQQLWQEIGNSIGIAIKVVEMFELCFG